MGHLKSLGLVMVAQFILWLLLNIGVPIFGPMCVVISMSSVLGEQAADAMLRDAIDDGQLYWAAIGLSASGLYEVLTANSGAAWPSVFCTFFGAIYGVVGVGSIVAIVVAVAGQNFNRVLSDEVAAVGYWPWRREGGLGLASIGLIKSPDKFARWSMRFVFTSATASACFHAANVWWLALM